MGKPKITDYLDFEKLKFIPMRCTNCNGLTLNVGWCDRCLRAWTMGESELNQRKHGGGNGAQ